MKRLGFLLFALVLAAAPANAAMDITLLNVDFIRGSGSPITETRTFTGFAGLATINIYNGAQNDSETGERVSSSVIKVNGVDVFGTADFNQTIAGLTKQLDLAEGENTIAVQLMGKPGGKIRVEVVQEVEEGELVLAGQRRASQICWNKIEQLGDTEEARLEAVALIKNLPGVSDSGVSEDGTVWIEYQIGIEGLILLKPDGTLGGGNLAQEEIDPSEIKSSYLGSDVLIWDPFNIVENSEFEDIFKNSTCEINVDYFNGSSCDTDSVYAFPNSKVLLLFTHGGLSNSNEVVFTTGQLLNSHDKFLVQTNPDEYKKFAAVTIKNETYYGIKPGFIDKLGGSFNDTIVFGGFCSSYFNQTMADEFIIKGAKVFYGFSGPKDRLEPSFAIKKSKELFESIIIGQSTANEAYESIFFKCDLLPFYSCLEMQGDGDFKFSCNDPDETITFKFSGTLNSDTGYPPSFEVAPPRIRFNAGDKFEGYITYNLNTKDSCKGSSQGCYYDDKSVNLLVTFTNSSNGDKLTIYSDPAGYLPEIGIYDNSYYGGADLIYIGIPFGIGNIDYGEYNEFWYFSFEIHLYDPEGNAIDDDALPTSIDVGDWNYSGFQINNMGDGDDSWFGNTIESFERIN